MLYQITKEFLEKINLGVLEQCTGLHLSPLLLENQQVHLCFTCKNYIVRSKMPPMSTKNNLQLVDLNGYEELHLTELENSLIAPNITTFCIVELNFKSHEFYIYY